VAEIKVAGKKVVLRDRFPGKMFYPLHATMRWFGTGHNLGERTFEEDVRPYVGTVLQWEFPGDPEKLESWEDLDVLTELPELIGKINEHIADTITKAFEASKNSTPPPTSP
jgi:hypothetical protein